MQKRVDLVCLNIYFLFVLQWYKALQMQQIIKTNMMILNEMPHINGYANNYANGGTGIIMTEKWWWNPIQWHIISVDLFYSNCFFFQYK